MGQIQELVFHEMFSMRLPIAELSFAPGPDRITAG